MMDEGTSHELPIDVSNVISNGNDASLNSDSNEVDNRQIYCMISTFKITFERANWNAIGAVLFSAFSFLSIVLVPYHNVISYPYYWYESIFSFITGGVPCLVGSTLIQITTVLQYHQISRTIKFNSCYKLDSNDVVFLCAY